MSNACPRCGAARSGTGRYCPTCAYDFWGAAAGQEQQPVPTAPTQRSESKAGGGPPPWLWIVGAVIVAVLVVGGIGAALGGGAGDDGTAAGLDETPAESATARPTAKPTARPTARPTPAPTPVPAHTYEEQFQAAINLSYEELFRNAEEHIGDSIYYRGEIIQVLGEPGDWQYRINVTKGDFGLWDDSVLVVYEGTDRFLEDDIVDFVGLSAGPYTYESVLGGDITVPLLYVDSNGMRLVQ